MSSKGLAEAGLKTSFKSGNHSKEHELDCTTTSNSETKYCNTWELIVVGIVSSRLQNCGLVTFGS